MQDDQCLVQAVIVLEVLLQYGGQGIVMTTQVNGGARHTDHVWRIGNKALQRQRSRAALVGNRIHSAFPAGHQCIQQCCNQKRQPAAAEKLAQVGAEEQQLV